MYKCTTERRPVKIRPRVLDNLRTLFDGEAIGPEPGEPRSSLFGVMGDDAIKPSIRMSLSNLANWGVNKFLRMEVFNHPSSSEDVAWLAIPVAPCVAPAFLVVVLLAHVVMLLSELELPAPYLIAPIVGLMKRVNVLHPDLGSAQRHLCVASFPQTQHVLQEGTMLSIFPLRRPKTPWMARLTEDNGNNVLASRKLAPEAATSDNGGPSAATARGPVVAATKDVSASTANKESREAVRPIDMQPAEWRVHGLA
eukprot:CAMPEP_0117521536 /NCGR_PEP_ID=MMETSP0784-20121206/33735_1 /TAXON_ID=39447 /ORGANISM="" /LENGTH=252 /DNA_ID=CAMNT_0005317565 /DNA_START=55 /DNA_END=817 /DNA_ORIENTATION=-